MVLLSSNKDGGSELAVLGDGSMKYQVYRNGKKFKESFVEKHTAEANVTFWKMLGVTGKLEIKEVPVDR